MVGTDRFNYRCDICIELCYNIAFVVAVIYKHIMGNLDSLRNFLLTIEHFIGQKTNLADQAQVGPIPSEDNGKFIEEDEFLAELDNLFQSASLEELHAMRQRICIAGLGHIDNALEQLGKK